MSYNKETGIFDGYIYQINNTENDLSYIGQTIRTPEIRFKQHIKDAKAQKDKFIFHENLLSIGYEKFNVKTLDIVQSNNIYHVKQELDNLEKYYIAKYNTKFPNGYNMTTGGQGIQPKAIKLFNYDGELIEVFSSIEEASWELKLAASAISINCRGITLGTRLGVFRYFGDDFSTFPAMYRPDGAISICLYDYYGNILKKYNSIADYARDYKTTRTAGSRYLKSHMLVDYDYTIFKSNEIFDKRIIKFPSYSPIAELDNIGNIVMFYRNASIAARANNIDASSVIKCCKGKIRSRNGKKFIYANIEQYIEYLFHSRIKEVNMND